MSPYLHPSVPVSFSSTLTRAQEWIGNGGEGEYDSIGPTREIESETLDGARRFA